MLSVDDIQSMRRNELQALAKQHGIRANQKSTVLMEQLCKIIGNDDAKSATTAPVAPEDKTDNQNTISPQTLDKDYVTSATRKELQALCKQNGIRANQKSAVLREELLKLCVPADTKCDDAVDDSAEPCDNVAQDEQEIDAAGDVSEGINANNVATSTPAEATKPTPDADNSHNNSAEVAETAQPNATSTLSQNEDPATASQKPPMTSDMAKIVLTSMLSSHAPEKLANVDKLLAKHVGKEDELLQKVAAKYGIGLKKAGTDEDKAQPNKSVAAVRRAGRTPIKRPVTRPSRIKNAGRALNKPKPKAHTPRAATVARPTVPTIRGGGEVVCHVLVLVARCCERILTDSFNVLLL